MAYRSRRSDGAAGRMSRRGSLLAGVGLAVVLAAGPALAQSELEEVVVTAQKRETNLQSTPIAISAFGGSELERRDIRDVVGLSFAVPGLIHSEAVTQQQITLRGIGLDIPNLAGEPGVAVHIDGVYIGSLSGVTAAFGELERVEVLRGPQGTLYGRNATGGSVNMITKKPSSSFGFEGRALYGNYDRVQLSASLTGPLAEGVSGRLSYDFEDRDGYRRNLFDGKRLDDAHRHSVRGALRFEPADDLEIILRGDYHKDDVTGIPDEQLALGRDPSLGKDVVQVLPNGARVTNNEKTLFLDFPNRVDRVIRGGSGTAVWSGDVVKLTSITAYREDRLDLATDSDGTELLGLHILNLATTDQFSQEFQVTSQTDGPLQWIAGVYYLDKDDRVDVDAVFDLAGEPTPFQSSTRQSTRSLAAFGELYFDLTDKVKLTGGLRYSRDRKSFTNSFGSSNKGTFDALTPKLGIEFQATDDLFFYYTLSRGFKGGGFDIFGTGLPFDPEYIWAHEVGMKLEAFERRVRFNASAFAYDYSDLQVTQFPGDGTQFIVNAASANIRGLDIDFQARPTAWLQFDGALAFLDAEFDEFETADLLDPTGPIRDLGGNRLIRAPEFSGNLGVTVTAPLGADHQAQLRGEYSYVDDYFFTVFNRAPARQPSYTMLNAFLTVSPKDDRWSVNLFARNISDEPVLSSAFEQPGGGGVVGGYLSPRTVGISVSVKLQ